MIAFTVPGNPIPWQRAGAKVIRGRVMFFTKPETRAYEAVVAAHAKGAGLTPLAGAVGIRLKFFRATRLRCDLDNLEKAVKDALNGIAWLDDSQVFVVTKCKTLGDSNPRTEVEIYPIPDAQLAMALESA